MRLERFVSAQRRDFSRALQEIENGRKLTHWMWYIFPQLQGLGHSDMAQFYGIEDLEEAKAYLAHPELSKNLETACQALLELDTDDAVAIFGHTDAMKLRSCMTLFAIADEDISLYGAVLEKFFDGRYDRATLNILGMQ